MEFIKGVKLEKIVKDLQGFDHEVIMYIYHKLNGREDEADSYLNSYINDVNDIISELKPVTNEAFQQPEQPTLKISIPDEVELDEVEEVHERQGAMVECNPSQPIKFNLHNFFE